ncbi:type 2 lantibiotic biosynthesis protein LanM [Labrenzia sp. EL_13]|nr:type 2 lantibiotic biosynthesis protein LanM [Labrenzia sp. EL_13]
MPTTLSQNERRTLAAKATTLDERLAGHVETMPLDGAAVLAAPRIKSWATTASGDDARVLEKILAERNTNLDALTPAFGPVTFPNGKRLPAWLDTFCWILDTLDRPYEEELESEPSLPFKPMFASLVTEARRRRDRILGADAEVHFSVSGLNDLDLDLYNAAVSVCRRGLLDAFTLARHMSGGMLGTAAAGAHHVSDADQFAANLKGKQLKAFFVDRPVLARLLATVTEQWIEVTSRFITRVSRDRMCSIAELLGVADPGRVDKVGCGLSDRHRGGQSVYKVTFESGSTVGYKPKDLSVDRAFNTLLEWMEADGAPASAGTVDVCPRPGYGWVEWVQHAPCGNEEEAKTFFHRSGAMLCLIRMLQGNDFHFENVVARGCVPVPIDLETITHPRLKEIRPDFESESAFFKTMILLSDSVANVGYLPNYIPIPGGGVAKVGGLDVFDHAVSDDDDASSEAKSARNPNLPLLEGKPLSVAQYGKDLLAGYRAMFSYIVQNGARIAAPGGPLDAFEDCLIRPVLRATRIYGMIQHRSLARRSVVDGAAWSGEFDMLSRVSITPDGDDELNVLCSYERTAMAEFDIPFYQASTSSADLILGNGEVIHDFFEAACLETVRDRFNTAPRVLLHRDEILIERSLRMGAGVAAKPASVEVTGALVSASGLVSRALELGEKISASAVRAGGATSWLDAVPVAADDRMCQPQALGPALIAGSDGVAMFFADLYAATADPRWKREAEAASAYSTGQAEVSSRMQAVSMLIPLGLGTGIGGLIQAQTGLASAFGADRHLHAAQRYADAITDTRIAEAKDFSQFSGLSGAISALAGLYRVDPSADLADKIARAAHRLAEARKSRKQELEGWIETGWRIPQVGVVHGASGIALALCEAYEICPQSEILEAARTALAFEADLFDRCAGWPDLRDAEKVDDAATAPISAGYTAGAAGVGLARLALARFDVFDRASLRTDVLRAVSIVNNSGPAETDSLFDGRAGHALYLTRAAAQMPGTAELLAGPSMLTRMLEDAEENGNFRWLSGSDGENPSVLHGAAGVGAALLECAGEAHATRLLTFGNFEPTDALTRLCRPASTAA